MLLCLQTEFELGMRRACAPLYTRGWIRAYEPGVLLPPGAGAPAAGSIAGPCAAPCSALPGALGSSGPAGGSSGPIGRCGALAAAAWTAGAGAEGTEYEETGSRSDAPGEGTATGAAGSGAPA